MLFPGWEEKKKKKKRIYYRGITLLTDNVAALLLRQGWS